MHSPLLRVTAELCVVYQTSILDVPGSNLCHTLSYQFFRGFSQSLQADAGTGPQIRSHLLPNPFQFIILIKQPTLITRSYTVTHQ
jgi:hypothetical protein